MPFIATDITAQELHDSQYDLAFFASGYESRCQFVPTMLERSQPKQVIVLGFEEFRDVAQRKDNDEYFETTWDAIPLVIRSDSDSEIYHLLNDTVPDVGLVRILVDYTAMSRLWWTAVLNWIKYQSSERTITLDFVYCPGVYEKNISPSIIDDIVALPGCEGGSIGHGKTIAIVGLGFSGVIPRCVLEHLEPDIIYAMLASPGAFPHYVDRVKENNASLLLRSRSVVESPLKSVEMAVRALKQLVLPLIGTNDVVLVPMGPKPHVLASVLVALEYQDLTCLRVSLRRETPIVVGASGDSIVTRVEFAALESLVSVAN